MFVAVYHQFKDPQVALRRGQKLIKNEDAPLGVRGLQFYPSRDITAATCLWESGSVDDVQRYVDEALGDSSVNTCWEVDAEMAFAEQPQAIRTPAAARA
jgi:hypothetical protein